MDMSPMYQVWSKPSCKTQWKREKDKAARRRGGKTISGNGQAWRPPSPRGQWRTEKNGGNWSWSQLWCSNDPRSVGIGEGTGEVKYKSGFLLGKASIDSTPLSAPFYGWCTCPVYVCVLWCDGFNFFFFFTYNQFHWGGNYSFYSFQHTGDFYFCGRTRTALTNFPSSLYPSLLFCRYFCLD